MGRDERDWFQIMSDGGEILNNVMFAIVFLPLLPFAIIAYILGKVFGPREKREYKGPSL